MGGEKGEKLRKALSISKLVSNKSLDPRREKLNLEVGLNTQVCCLWGRPLELHSHEIRELNVSQVWRGLNTNSWAGFPPPPAPVLEMKECSPEVWGYRFKLTVHPEDGGSRGASQLCPGQAPRNLPVPTGRLSGDLWFCGSGLRTGEVSGQWEGWGRERRRKGRGAPR